MGFPIIIIRKHIPIMDRPRLRNMLLKSPRNTILRPRGRDGVWNTVSGMQFRLLTYCHFILVHPSPSHKNPSQVVQNNSRFFNIGRDLTFEVLYELPVLTKFAQGILQSRFQPSNKPPKLPPNPSIPLRLRFSNPSHFPWPSRLLPSWRRHSTPHVRDDRPQSPRHVLRNFRRNTNAICSNIRRGVTCRGMLFVNNFGHERGSRIK